MKNMTSKRWLSLASVFLYAAAVFQITDEHWLLGVTFFAAATTIMCAGACTDEKKENESDTRTVCEGKKQSA